MSSDLSVSSEGYFVLSWESDDPEFERVLQQATDSTFSTELEQWSVTGASQFTQSGLVNGIYFYRLVDNTGNSNTVSVEVAHHPLGRAALFFLLGAILFSILVAVLIFGRQQVQRAVNQ